MTEPDGALLWSVPCRTAHAALIAEILACGQPSRGVSGAGGLTVGCSPGTGPRRRLPGPAAG